MSPTWTAKLRRLLPGISSSLLLLRGSAHIRRCNLRWVSATLPAGKCLGVYVCEAAALAAGVEDANQPTIEIRDGQAVLGGAVVS